MLYLSRYERVCLTRTRARFKWDYKSDLVLKDILGQTDRGAQNNLSAICRCEIKIDNIYTLT